jgi:hypothetical protein
MQRRYHVEAQELRMAHVIVGSAISEQMQSPVR